MNTNQISQLSAIEKLELVKELLKKKAEVRKFSPLSYGQKALWFIYKTSPASSAYNTAFAAKMGNGFDPHILKNAFSKLIKRHTILTTTYHEEDGKPLQQINPEQLLNFEEINLTEEDLPLNEKIKEIIQMPFDLDEGPIYRIVLIRSLANKNLSKPTSPIQNTLSYELTLVFSVHHIAYDEWSSSILLKDLKILYEAEMSSKAPELCHQPVHYFDYVEEQSKMVNGEKGKQLLAYWSNQLQGETLRLGLPTDYPRPAIQTFRGDSFSFVLDEKLTGSLRELAKANGITLYTCLLSVFQILLSKYSGQKDILVGSPVAGRNQLEHTSLVGYFVNPVVLRGNLQGNPTLVEYLKRNAKVVMDALAHQDYPFPLLIEKLQKDRDSSASPLFQVAFSLLKENSALISGFTSENTSSLQEPKGFDIELIETPIQEGAFDITLELMESQHYIKGRFKYNSDLFQKTTAERMVNHLINLLNNSTLNPEGAISDLQMISKSEIREIIKLNETTTPYPSDKTIQELFEAEVLKTPNAIALVSGNITLTYEQLNEKANRLAFYIREKFNIQPDDFIGIVTERSEWTIISILGVLKAGAAYVPIDPAYPVERIKFMLDDTSIKALLIESAAHLNEDLAIAFKAIVLNNEWPVIEKYSGANPFNLNRPSDLTYIMYTSGSTGKPKGVMIEHKSVVRLVRDSNYINIRPSDRILQLSNFAFDGSTFDIFGALLNGASIYMIPKITLLSESKLAEFLKENQINITFITTAFFNNLVDLCPEVLTQFDKIYFGGESTSVAHVKKSLSYLKSGDCLVNVYGPTEGTTFSCYYVINSLDEKSLSVPIGKPISNTTIYILDDYKNMLPPGVPGEIYIGGAGIARGYSGQDDLTNEKFISNPFDSMTRLYKTGDFGKWLPDGNIEFIGRKDNQIKIRGHRIELGEIEAALSQHPGVKERVVLANEAKDGQKNLIAFIIPIETGSINNESLRDFLRQELADYMVPQTFILLDKFPLNSNGKIDRKALLESLSMQSIRNNFAPPQTFEEQQLAAIWMEILNIETVGINDHFFELGGNSLLAMQVLSRIRSVLGCEIAITDLFKEPTIATIAKIIQRNKDAVQVPAIKRVSREKYVLKA